MKKEKVYFCNWGIFALRCYTYKISDGMNWGNIIKKNNVLLCGTAQLTKINRSFTKCLTLILQEKKTFVLIIKKRSFDISYKPWIAAQQALCLLISQASQRFTVDLTRTELRFRWCQYRLRRGKPCHPVSPEAFILPGFLWRTKQGCPGLNKYLCYSFPLKWQLCYLFAIPLVSGNDLSVELCSSINKVGLSQLGSEHSKSALLLGTAVVTGPRNITTTVSP